MRNLLLLGTMLGAMLVSGMAFADVENYSCAALQARLGETGYMTLGTQDGRYTFFANRTYEARTKAYAQTRASRDGNAWCDVGYINGGDEETVRYFYRFTAICENGDTRTSTYTNPENGKTSSWDSVCRGGTWRPVQAAARACSEGAAPLPIYEVNNEGDATSRIIAYKVCVDGVRIRVDN